MPVCACVPLCVLDNYHLLKPKLRPLHCTAKRNKLPERARCCSCLDNEPANYRQGKGDARGALCYMGGYTGNCVKPFRR